MQTVTTIASLRAHLHGWRLADQRIAFVPTMGNLHAGHLSLVHLAKERGDRVVVSVFVNPTQFGPAEDYAGYPRTLDEDKRLLEEAGIDLLFAPSVEEIYPHGESGRVRVEVPGLSNILCGAFRPGHFSGVATVVAKLFNIVQPDLAVFGEKDYQQLLVIRKLVEDLDFPAAILGAPVGRERDGLAYSSRNRYLTATEREQAPLLQQTLKHAVARLAAGDRDFGAIQAEGRERLEQHGFRPDYFEVRNATDLAAPNNSTRDFVVLAAAYLGRARLIDNLRVSVGA